MTPEDRLAKIESYGRAHALLTEALQEFPKAMWQFRPAPDRWTIHEIVIHIADSEAGSYFRCRRLIAEPGSGVPGYDENRWALALHYHEQDPGEALELFRLLRRQSYRLIRGLPESVWTHAVEHSESGRMTMEDWLTTYERHVPDHIEQMREDHRDWKRATTQ